MTAIFTASHNPAEYTGIKCFDRYASLTPTDHLKNIFTQAYKFRENKTIPQETKPYSSRDDVVKQKVQ
jgi:phosphomannomutase